MNNMLKSTPKICFLKFKVDAYFNCHYFDRSLFLQKITKEMCFFFKIKKKLRV